MSSSPGQKLVVVVAQEDLGLAQNPALHFEAQKQQPAIVLGHLNGLIKVKGQELIAAESFRRRP